MTQGYRWYALGLLALINLLNDKNYHLQKFHQMNETELMNFTEGCFDGLETFYQSRETILDLIRCIDRDILRPIARLNFGREPRYSIRPRSLVETYAAMFGTRGQQQFRVPGTRQPVGAGEERFE